MRSSDTSIKLKISSLLQNFGRTSRPVRDSEPSALASVRSSQHHGGCLSPPLSPLPFLQPQSPINFLQRPSKPGVSMEKPTKITNVESIVAQMKHEYGRSSREVNALVRVKSEQGLVEQQGVSQKEKCKNSLEEIQQKIQRYSRRNRMQSFVSPAKSELSQQKSHIRPLLDEKTQKCKQLCLQLKKKLLKQTVSTTSSTDTFQRELSIEQFSLGRLLGEGKFSKVYLARHNKSGVLVALKIIKKQTIRRQRFQDQLARQVAIQSYFNHVNLVRLYGFFHDHTNVYLLMEYCPGGQLYDIFKVKSKLREEEWAPIMKGICEGLYVLHMHDVIHRDLKPENVMMGFGLPKLGDFGWAVHSPGERRDTFCGTPLYISPELLQGGHYDKQVDVWALGVMMFEFLTGRIPFKIDQQNNLLEIVNSKIVFPKTLTENCANLMGMILNKNPESRIGILDVLEHPFLGDSLIGTASQAFFLRSR